MPTIVRAPTSVVPPEGFRQLRQRTAEAVAAEDAAAARASAEAAREAARGGQGYLLTTCRKGRPRK